MEPPADDFREYVANRARQLYELENQRAAEELLAQLLADIEERIPLDEEDEEPRYTSYPRYEELPEEDRLAALSGYADVESWLTLASYATARIYAPQSPFRIWPQGTLAGVSSQVHQRLDRIVQRLRPALIRFGRAAMMDEVGVSFQWPFGVGAGVAWDVGPNSRQTYTARPPEQEIVGVRYENENPVEFVIQLNQRRVVAAVTQ